MRVCFFCGTLSSGGIGRVVSLISSYLAEKEEVEIFLLSDYDTEKSVYKVNSRCHKYSLQKEPCSMTNAICTGHIIKKTENYLKENDIDVVIACGALYYPVAAVAAKKIRCKLICWEHTDPNITTDYKFQGLCRSFGALLSDANLVLTKSAKNVYDHKYRSKRNIQIYNPVDPLLLKIKPQFNCTSKRIISVGRLNAQKNFDRLIDIAKVILNKKTEWSWDVFGDGELKEHLTERVIKEGLMGRLSFMGQVTDIYDRYQQYGMMVMTSDYEGFPMTLLEGAACGLPLVAFDVQTGPNEIIVDGENGFLCDQGDTNSMLQRIEQLIDSDELRVSQSQSSREYVKNFSIEKIAKEWMNLLRSMW